jgi:hypothetical protein
MWALIAVIIFAIAAFVAFTASAAISVPGLFAVGLACLALHLLWPTVIGYVRRN